MNTLDRAVRCLEIEEEAAGIEYRIRQLDAANAFAADDDDGARLGEIAGLRARLDALRAEQAELTAAMTGPVSLEAAAVAHADRAAG